MIGYLRGEILEHHEGRMIVVAGGVGYQIAAPNSAEYGTLQPGQEASFFIYTHVREDAFDLYAFATRGEKELFLTLLDVNGIGPKLALGLFSKIQPAQLVQAVLREDKAALTEIPGIGKKTAERIVLELSDKIQKKMEAGAFQGIPFSTDAAGRAARTNGASGSSKAGAMGSMSQVMSDARAALVGLGYREQEVTSLLNRVLEEFSAPPKQAEDLVKAALRQLL